MPLAYYVRMDGIPGIGEWVKGNPRRAHELTEGLNLAQTAVAETLKQETRESRQAMTAVTGTAGFSTEYPVPSAA